MCRPCLHTKCETECLVMWLGTAGASKPVALLHISLTFMHLLIMPLPQLSQLGLMLGLLGLYSLADQGLHFFFMQPLSSWTLQHSRPCCHISHLIQPTVMLTRFMTNCPCMAPKLYTSFGAPTLFMCCNEDAGQTSISLSMYNVRQLAACSSCCW